MWEKITAKLLLPGIHTTLTEFLPPKRLFVTDGYKSRIAYGMKPKRFEARNVKTMAYREKEPMILKDGLQLIVQIELVIGV